MGQRSNANNAAMKDVQIELRREGCALDMEHRLNTNDAEVKDAQILLGREEYVGDTEHTAILVEGCTNHSKQGGVCMSKERIQKMQH